MKIYLFNFLLLSFILNSCISNTKVEKENETLVSEPKSNQENSKGSLKLKFTDFVLGDAEHYYFEDEKGKKYEFGAVQVKNVEFAMELPEKEANSDNQGFGPNKSLVNKWFQIKFEEKEMPLYQDGPTGKVAVITDAVELK